MNKKELQYNIDAGEMWYDHSTNKLVKFLDMTTEYLIKVVDDLENERFIEHGSGSKDPSWLLFFKFELSRRTEYHRLKKLGMI